jgi:hypothetical protein
MMERMFSHAPDIEVPMAAYLVLLLAVLSRILPHTFHTTSVGFTAVGAGLLFFGARRGRWQTILAVLALMATDYYLTVYAYGYAFHPSSYLVTWAWYAGVCLLGHQMLHGKPSALRVAGAVLASSTSFFLLSNFVVWMGDDAMSTAITAGALFGLPVLAANIAESMREAQNSHRAA